MAIISNSTVQYKYLGNGFLDSKLDPYNTLSDLIKAYPRKYRKEGLFGVVLNTDKTLPEEKFPQVYVYYGGEWKPMDRIISEKVTAVIKTSDQNKSDLDKIKKDITAILSGLETKADKTEISNITSILEGKASKSELSNLSDAISKIAGIDKLVPGDGISLSKNEKDGTVTISGPNVDEFNNKLTNFEKTLGEMVADTNKINGFDERIKNVENGFQTTKTEVSTIVNNDIVQDKTISELKTKVDNLQPSGLDVAGDDGDENPTL